MTGDDFFALRHILGLTQAQLGATLGVHRNSIRRYESGAGPIPLAMQFALHHLTCIQEPPS